MGRSSGKVKKDKEPPFSPPVIRRWKDLPKDEKPVILRWQDLPKDDPNRDMIIVAPEDYMKENEKTKVKGEKAEGPALANYIKIGEFALACKMCPNPDWHPTFQCPNLTPELKEWLKEARLKGGTFRAFHPDDRYCHVCLPKDHWSSACPYQIELPVGATVGPLAEILCLCCGEERPHPGVPGVDWKARAVLKDSCMLGSPEALRGQLPPVASRQIHQQAQPMAQMLENRQLLALLPPPPLDRMSTWFIQPASLSA